LIGASKAELFKMLSPVLTLSQRRLDRRVVKHHTHPPLPARIANISTKNYCISQKKNCLFFAEVVVLLAKSSQFEEYLAKIRKDSNFQGHKE
jgi:hypothetical protein